MTDPDGRLAGKAVGGDREALARLYERHRRRLFGYLVRLIRDRELAEDVFQEAWIKVMERISSYRPGPAGFRAWLYRVASNAAIDRLRREARRRGPELDASITGDSSDESVLDRIASDAPGPDRLGESALLGRRLAIALDRLPDTQRAAVLLRHQQGLTYAELAKALAVPEGTGKVLVHRAVRSLKTELKEERNG